MIELYVDELVDINQNLMAELTDEAWNRFIENAPGGLNCNTYRDFLIPYGFSMLSRLMSAMMNELYTSINLRRMLLMDYVSIDPTDIYDSLDSDIAVENIPSHVSEIAYLWLECIYDNVAGNKMLKALERRFEQAKVNITNAMAAVSGIGIWSDVYDIEGKLWENFHILKVVQPGDYIVLHEGAWQAYQGSGIDISDYRMRSNTETFFMQHGKVFTDSTVDSLTAGVPYQLCALTPLADGIVTG